MTGPARRRKRPNRRIACQHRGVGAKPSFDRSSGKPYELLAYVVSYFVAAGANGRANRYEQVRRAASKLGHEALDGDNRHARCQSAPARVGGRHRLRPSIDHEDWQAISDPDRDRPIHIVSQDDVGLIEAAVVPFGVPGVPSPHDGSSTVNLSQAIETRQFHAHGFGDLNPAPFWRFRLPQFPCARSEEMRSKRRKGVADKGRLLLSMVEPHAWELHPAERAVRLGEREYHRSRARRDRHPAYCRHDRALRRALYTSYLYRGRGCVLHAAPRPVYSFRWALCCQGSGHEGARHGALERRAVARRRGGTARRPAATAVAWRRRSSVRGDRGPLVPADDHTFRCSRPRASNPPRRMRSD